MFGSTCSSFFISMLLCTCNQSIVIHAQDICEHIFFSAYRIYTFNYTFIIFNKTFYDQVIVIVIFLFFSTSHSICHLKMDFLLNLVCPSYFLFVRFFLCIQWFLNDLFVLLQICYFSVKSTVSYIAQFTNKCQQTTNKIIIYCLFISVV